MVAFAQATPSGNSTSAAVQRIVKQVARGVDLIQEITPASAPGGPLIVTVIRVDPKVPGTRVESALGQDRVWNTDPTFGREVVSKLVRRHKAVAGVNGGFFPFAGNPYGMHIQGGDLVTEPFQKALRTVFYVTKSGASGFARFTYSGSARIATGAQGASGAPLIYSIDGLNKKPGGEKDVQGELLLFTPIWSPTTLPIAGRTEIVLRGIPSPLQPNRDYVGTVAAIGVGGKSPLAPGTVVLSGVGPGADFLRAAAPGGKIAFRVGVTPAIGDTVDPQAIAHSVSGGPRILTNGVVTNRYREEGMGVSMSATSHPRTAVGKTADGKILLVTVDGRQKGLSGGAPFPKLAEILKRFGAVDGLNLDGGGSTTAIVWDSVANSPSEGVERPDADALLVYAEDLPVPSMAPAPTLNLPNRPLQVGEVWDFSGGASALHGDQAVWGETGGKGFVAQDGLFHALRPGIGFVRVTLGSRAHVLRTSVSVVGRSQSDAAGFAPKLALLPAALATPLEQTLTIHIANAEGDPDANEPIMLTITGGMAAAAGALTTNARGDARVVITWAAPLSATAPRSIQTTSPQKRFTSATLTLTTP